MRKWITLSLAWRNIWRNKRRTILTLLIILAGSAMIILMNAMSKGGHDQMINDAVAANTGHIQIHEKGFWKTRTIDYAFKYSDDLNKRLHDRRIAGFGRRIVTAGLLSHRGNTLGVVIEGIEPQKERNITNIHRKILPGGRYFTEADTGKVLLGETLAKNIEAKPGSIIALISQGFDGSIAAKKLQVIGLFKTNNSEYDNFLLLMPFEDAADTFTMMGYINSVVIKVRDASDISAVKKTLVSPSKSREAREIMGWDELMPELVQFIVMDEVSGYIFDLILFIVVAFGVLNTIQMAVFERTREIGIMLSVGTRPGQIVRMVLFESIFISLIGIALGTLLGYGLGYYFQINPIDYSAYTKEMEVWGMSTTIWPADVTFLNLSATALIIFVLSVLFSIFPARRASLLKPVEAIRQL